VTTLIDEHSYTSSGRRKTTTPTSSWVASLALPILQKKSFMGAKELHTTLQDTHSCQITYDTVWKGKEKALHQLYGTWEDSFKLLFRWKEAVLQKMTDSVIEIDIDEAEDGRLNFKMFFCALGPCLEGFHVGCMPYLSVDSTSLNGRWNGHLPSATGMDGHNWMYHVAFGFFEGESTDSWRWFLLQLHKAIGEPSPLAIHCDATKGLIATVRGVFPQAEMRECFRHLMQNYMKQFPEKDHVYPAARAYMREVHEQHKPNVVGIDGFVRWMKVNHPLLWY
jgi:hypothetical protein